MNTSEEPGVGTPGQSQKSRSRAAVNPPKVLDRADRTPDAAPTTRCLTCGRTEPLTKCGNCALIADKPGIILPQTESAAHAADLITELRRTDPGALRLIAQTGYVAAHQRGWDAAQYDMDQHWARLTEWVRAIPDRVTQTELEAIRGGPTDRPASRLTPREWDDCVTIYPPEPQPAAPDLEQVRAA